MSQATIDYIININTEIGVAVATDDAAFSRLLFLTDSTEMDPDKRYQLVTQSDYSDYFSSGTEAYNFLASHFIQTGKPSDALVGRWYTAATSSVLILKSPVTSALIGGPNNASFKLSDGTVTEEFSVDLSTATTLAQVLSAIQTEIRTGATLPGAASATVTSDDAGRILITNAANVGSLSLSWTMSAPAAGTDITTSSYLNITEYVSIPGYEVETPDSALDAIINDGCPSFIYVAPEDGISDANSILLDAKCASIGKFQCLRITDTDAKDSSSTSDIAYTLKTASSRNSFGIYTEHAVTSGGSAVAQNGEVVAAVIGNYSTANPGSKSPALNVLTSINPSGKALSGSAKDLTAGEKLALEGKNCGYITNPGGFPMLNRDRTFGGTELRVLVGAAYMNYRMQLDILNFMINADVVTFSDADLKVIEGILRRWLNYGVESNFIEPGFIISIPEASTISAATKASGTYTNLTIYTATIRSAINKFVITGKLQP